MPKQKLTYDQWLRVANALVQSRVGLSADDLDDQPWREWYDNGSSALSAAREAIRATKASMGME